MATTEVRVNDEDARRMRLCKVSLRHWLKHAKIADWRGSCGGRGVCGKCRVEVDGESVLACQTRLTGPASVVVPAAALALRGGVTLQ